jgi:hypothetical protein
VRRLAAASGALILAALVLSTTSQAASSERVGCKMRRLTILIWPEGHGAIESVDFPEQRLPHLEVYKPGPPFPDSNFRAFVGSGAGQWARSCRALPDGKTPSGIEGKETLTETSALQCTLPKRGILERVDKLGRSVLRVFAGTDLYVKVVITARGARADYDSSVCEAMPAPS